MKLPDKAYNILKWIALIALPAFSWFYQLLADTWGLPYSSQIATTLSGLGTLIGILIGVSALAIRKEKGNDPNEVS